LPWGDNRVSQHACAARRLVDHFHGVANRRTLILDSRVLRDQ